LIVTI